MSTYARPPLAIAPLLRDDGLPYGSGWADDSPPQETYSRITHPERFAPLHAVADALLAHLVETYDVAVDDAPFDDELTGPTFEIVRAVRLVPVAPDAAPLTIAWTPYPGIRLLAGAAAQFAEPVCGCDACDDDVKILLDDLESTMLAIAAGGLTETLRDRWLTTGLTLRGDRGATGHGTRIGSTRSSTRVSVAEAERVRAVLASTLHGWAPWPLRS